MLGWQPDQILLEVLDWRWGLDDWADQVRLEVLDRLEDLVLAERLDLQPNLVRL